MPTEFLVEDEGDGWWHCPSPLRCTVIDGPEVLHPGEPDKYWLVRTDPRIEWHGDPGYAKRWGPEHPLCWSIEPTSFALVMAYGGRLNYAIDTTWDGGIPVIPVLNEPKSVREAIYEAGLGVKAVVRAPDD